MKTPLFVVEFHIRSFIRGVFAVASILATASLCPAAYLIEASNEVDALGLGSFAYTGAGGTAASYSDASAGNLPATTDATPTFFTLRHAYGGNGTTDEYTFTYSPALHADNVSFAAGTLFNSLGTATDLVSSGLSGGGDGFYNIYRIQPATTNVSGGLTTYRVFYNEVELTGLAQSIDQNAANIASGTNIGRWELIGSIAIPIASDTVTVKMTPDVSTFVSMRASGIMFEYVAAIPEPSFVTGFAALASLTLVVLGRSRGRTSRRS